MADLSKLSASALSAAMRGGTTNWGVHGSAEMHVRYAETITYRRKCHCGCARWATHIGFANGVCLMTGCELSVRRWVRDPAKLSPGVPRMTRQGNPAPDDLNPSLPKEI